jgi:hypothetical protein
MNLRVLAPRSYLVLYVDDQVFIFKPEDKLHTTFGTQLTIHTISNKPTSQIRVPKNHWKCVAQYEREIHIGLDITDK